MATHSSALAWKIPWTEEPGGLQPVGLRRVQHDSVTSLYFSLSCIGEGNGSPLQCSCWRIPGMGEPGGLLSMGSHSQTRLKQLSSNSSKIRMGFPCSSVGKESACSAGDLDSVPGSGRSPGEGNGNPLQYSCLESSMDRGAW